MWVGRGRRMGSVRVFEEILGSPSAGQVCGNDGSGARTDDDVGGPNVNASFLECFECSGMEAEPDESSSSEYQAKFHAVRLSRPRTPEIAVIGEAMQH